MGGISERSTESDGKTQTGSGFVDVTESQKLHSEKGVGADASGGIPESSIAEKDDGNVLEESELRYLAYASRAVNIFKTKMRIMAYSSDIGESSRPVAPNAFVKAMYGLTFAYIGVDVGIDAYHEWKHGGTLNSISRVIVHTTIFQTIASVLVPSAIIHTAVHRTQKFVNARPSVFAKKYAPVAAGLALIPALPIVDHPIEWLIEKGMDKVWPTEASDSTEIHGETTKTKAE